MIKFRNALTAFLIGACVVSVLHYSFLLKEKISLSRSLEEVQSRVSSLEKEKVELAQSLDRDRESLKKLDEENAQLKEALKVNSDKLAELQKDVDKARTELQDLSLSSNLLRSENAALKDQVHFIVKEEEKLRFSMTSLPELKKAIRELKKKKNNVKTVSVFPRAKKKSVDKGEIIGGNKGFLIKDGKPTCVKNIKIEVVPTPSQ